MSNSFFIRSTTVLLVLLFVASFLIPALCNQQEGEVCKQAFPGYIAAMGSMLAIRALLEDLDDFAENPLGGIYTATAWTANIPFIVLSLLLLVSPKRPLPRWAVIATALAAVYAWLVPVVVRPGNASIQELFLPGYWLWVSSLSLMAVWVFAVNRASNRPQT